MSEAQVSQPAASPTGSPTASPPTGSPTLLNEPVTSDPVRDGVSLLNDTKPALKPEGEAEGAPKEPPAKAGAPEAYAEFTAPEGFEIDPTALAEATPLFKELGLDQARAQKLVDFYAKQSQQAAEAPFKLWQDTQKEWVDSIKADPEIGGKLDTVRATVAKVIDSLGPELAADFRQAMDFTGAGNNPAFVKVMFKLAAQLTEGGFVRGGNPSAGGQGNQGRPASAAQALYPNLPSAG
jgi:hypothetical protein